MSETNFSIDLIIIVFVRWVVWWQKLWIVITRFAVQTSAVAVLCMYCGRQQCWYYRTMCTNITVLICLFKKSSSVIYLDLWLGSYCIQSFLYHKMASIRRIKSHRWTTSFRSAACENETPGLVSSARVGTVAHTKSCNWIMVILDQPIYLS